MWRSPIAIAFVLLTLIGCWFEPVHKAAVPRNAEEKTAMEVARRFLKDKNLDWGEPTRFTNMGDPNFIGVMYPTPEDEIKVLGERAVSVDVKAQRASLIPRH